MKIKVYEVLGSGTLTGNWNDEFGRLNFNHNDTWVHHYRYERNRYYHQLAATNRLGSVLVRVYRRPQ